MTEYNEVQADKRSNYKKKSADKAVDAEVEGEGGAGERATKKARMDVEGGEVGEGEVMEEDAAEEEEDEDAPEEEEEEAPEEEEEVPEDAEEVPEDEDEALDNGEDSD